MSYSTAFLDEVIEKQKREREKQRLLTIEKVFSVIDHLSGEMALDEIYLFGSVTKPFRFSEESDIDLACTGLKDRHFFKLMSAISRATGHDVDIVQLENHRLADKIKREGIKWKKKN